MEINDLLGPEEGWVGVELAIPLGVRRSFVSGEPEGERLRVRYYRRTKDGALVGKVWFGPGTEGPPGHAHGGSIAAVLDEAMVGACALAGLQVLAGQLNVHFKSKIPLESVPQIQAKVDRVSGRKVRITARIHTQTRTLAQAQGVFVQVGKEHLGPLAEIAAAWYKSESQKWKSLSSGGNLPPP